MIYGKELGEVMRARPTHEFRMGELVCGVERILAGKGVEISPKKRRAIRTGVADLLRLMASGGSIKVRRAKTRGSFATYQLKSDR